MFSLIFSIPFFIFISILLIYLESNSGILFSGYKFVSFYIMIKVAVLILLGLLQLSFCQPFSIKKAELKQVFKSILSTDTYKKTFFLIDSIQHFENKSVTQQGIDYSIAETEIVNKGVFTSELFDSAKIISLGYIDSVSMPYRGRNTPHYYTFSLPYFSRDKKSFIIYYSYYCGSLCAEYSLRLYKKINGRWVYIKYFFRDLS